MNSDFPLSSLGHGIHKGMALKLPRISLHTNYYSVTKADKSFCALSNHVKIVFLLRNCLIILQPKSAILSNLILNEIEEK